MNAPQRSTDPLLRGLSEEAADLPLRAALEARQASARRRRIRRRSALAASACMMAILAWAAWPSIPELKPGPPASGSIVKQHPEPPVHPPALPPGLDPDQLALVKAAGDLPVLLVRDKSGRVTRVHLIER